MGEAVGVRLTPEEQAVAVHTSPMVAARSPSAMFAPGPSKGCHAAQPEAAAFRPRSTARYDCPSKLRRERLVGIAGYATAGMVGSNGGAAYLGGR